MPIKLPATIFASTTANEPRPPPVETKAQHQQRLAWETAAIEAGRRAYDEEGGAPLAEVIAWVESWDTPHERPMPTPRK